MRAFVQYPTQPDNRGSVYAGQRLAVPLAALQNVPIVDGDCLVVPGGMSTRAGGPESSDRNLDHGQFRPLLGDRLVSRRIPLPPIAVGELAAHTEIGHPEPHPNYLDLVGTSEH